MFCFCKLWIAVVVTDQGPRSHMAVWQWYLRILKEGSAQSFPCNSTITPRVHTRAHTVLSSQGTQIWVRLKPQQEEVKISLLANDYTREMTSTALQILRALGILRRTESIWMKGRGSGKTLGKAGKAEIEKGGFRFRANVNKPPWIR